MNCFRALLACSCICYARCVQPARVRPPPNNASMELLDGPSLRSGRGLPSIGAFEFGHRYRHAQDPNKQKQLPHGVQVVFGVTTMITEKMAPFWGVIKETWMQQPGVCTLGSPPRQLPDCSVYVTRVAGRPDGMMPLDRAGSFSGEDVLQLNQTENMDKGKTFWLLHVLAQEVPWATHIAKVDMDAYPYVYNLVSFLHSKQGCAAEYQFMGSPMLGPCDMTKKNMYEWCPSDHCGEPELKCLNFNQGGMYVLSRSLALGVTQLGGAYDRKKVGFEDQVLGAHVKDFVKAKGACISFWRAHFSWHHKNQVWVDPERPASHLDDYETVKDGQWRSGSAFEWKMANCGKQINHGKKWFELTGFCKIPK